METFIISFVVIILLVLAMSLILKNTVKTIDDKSKSYFVDKLKQYDYLIDEKEKKLSELEEELEKRKNGLEENKTREGKPTYDFDNSIIDLLTETNYLDKNIFAINKKIEEKFIINYEDLIKAGANFASSPKRVNIHALDPAIVASSISLSDKGKPIDLIGILDKTKYGASGIGGIITNGTMYVGYPR